MGIEEVWASVQNILACKYIAPMGIEIVSVVVQIIPEGKNLPHRLQMRILVPLHGNETGWEVSADLYNIKIQRFKLTFHFQGFIVINPFCS